MENPPLHPPLIRFAVAVIAVERNKREKKKKRRTINTPPHMNLRDDLREEVTKGKAEGIEMGKMSRTCCGSNSERDGLRQRRVTNNAMVVVY